MGEINLGILSNDFKEEPDMIRIFYRITNTINMKKALFTRDKATRKNIEMIIKEIFFRKKKK